MAWYASLWMIPYRADCLPLSQWPYTYDACDYGTTKNQTRDDLPAAALTDNDQYHDGALSYQPGQRLSRCTCPGESHPGPQHENGEYVGRGAPEIDMFEAQVRYLARILLPEPHE